MSTPATAPAPVPPSAGPDPSYPLTLRVAGRRCVVVGAGPVGARRARSLVEAGAQVVVVAPTACPDVMAAAREGRLTWIARDYLTGDLDGAWLVHAATGVAEVDEQVCDDAEWQRVWAVRASDRERSSAWTPAVARVDDVLVAVNAGGDPRRAVALRDHVAADLRELAGQEHGRGGAPRERDAAPREDASAPGPRADLPDETTPDAAARGTVALVGGGPGDEGLLTVRARELIARADVVVIDRLAPQGVLADLAPHVEVVDVGKSSGFHPVPQDEINATLVRHALAGKHVVRLKGGDPYVFGRGGEELDACVAAGIEVEVVPGVTSAISVPAAAGIPLTHRSLSRGFTVLTGHADVGRVPEAPDHTLVLLMGVRRLGTTCDELVARGRAADTPVAVIEDGFGRRQRTTVGTLSTIAERAAAADVQPPAIAVVGRVVTRAPEWAAWAGRPDVEGVPTDGSSQVPQDPTAPEQVAAR
ncbi:uroporphyrinogen-III C-methyltransferase [Flavimobilis soli]|uniref:Uroporphyrinogen-III C-methyltransferase n=1 Tax=Flavimobilis soli TaxID=442709 RepID=A0A2A9EB32_9MICO|nr:uroporphyrinogen-III C-methyltransferase [Flavimobilis soli]PFG36158.1 uroporphyrinogen-III C-methyltransferase [Flavimobilis soli]